MKLNRCLISALLLLTVLAVYWPATGYDFVNVNDFDYVSKNEHINHGLSWANVAWAFNLKSLVAANWHPITVLSHMLDCQMYGLNAGRHHLTSILLHTANSLLLFWMLLDMTRRRTTPGSEIPAQDAAADSTFWPCAFVALLFALHPLRVESVVWISERKDVLSVFFFLLTLWSYLRYVENSNAQPNQRKAVAWYAASLLFYALGLMSKPMLVTLPCVLLLLDYWPLGRIRDFRLRALAKAAINKIPFFLLTAGFSVITFWSQKSVGAMGSLEKLPVTARLANATVSYARYLGKTVWPDSLAVLYPLPEAWAAWKIAGAALLFFAFCALALWSIRRRPYLFVGWFWFVGMLVPVIGLVQVGQQAMADRFTYLPSIGLLMAVAWGLDDLFAYLGRRNFLAFPGIALAAACLTVTGTQIRYWQNTETLLQRTVAVTGKNPRANATLGTTFANEGKWDEAEKYLNRAIQEKPDFAEAHADLAGVYARQRKMAEAEHSYETALRLKPALPLAHFGLANLLMKKGQFDEAAAHLMAAVHLLPDFAPAHYLLSVLLIRQHEPAAAISHLELAVRAKPDWTPALNSLAWNLATQSNEKLRNGKEATSLALRAVRSKGKTDPGLLDTLAAAYAETGRYGDAVETAGNAAQQARATGQNDLAEAVETHLKSYQAQQPWRE